MSVPTVEQSAEAREIGMARVSRAVSIVWRARAIGYIREFAAYAREPFLAEDVREFAESSGLQEPTNAKAWGPVMQAAMRDGIIRPVGYAPARSSNGSPKVLWRAA